MATSPRELYSRLELFWKFASELKEEWRKARAPLREAIDEIERHADLGFAREEFVPNWLSIGKSIRSAGLAGVVSWHEAVCSHSLTKSPHNAKRKARYAVWDGLINAVTESKTDLIKTLRFASEVSKDPDVLASALITAAGELADEWARIHAPIYVDRLQAKAEKLSISYEDVRHTANPDWAISTWLEVWGKRIPKPSKRKMVMPTHPKPTEIKKRVRKTKEESDPLIDAHIEKHKCNIGECSIRKIVAATGCSMGMVNKNKSFRQLQVETRGHRKAGQFSKVTVGLINEQRQEANAERGRKLPHRHRND